MIERLIHKVDILQTQVGRLQTFRLYSFFTFIAILAFCYFTQLEVLYIPVISIFILLFFYLLLKYRRIKRFTAQVEKLLHFQQRQAARKSGGYKLETLPPYADVYKEVAVSRDLDLIGEKSIYSLLTECITEEGDQFLLQNILHGNTKTESYRSQILSGQLSYHKEKRHYTKMLGFDKLRLEPLMAWSKEKIEIPSYSFYFVYAAYILFLASLFSPFKNIGLILYVLSYVISFSAFYRAYEKAIELEVVLFSLKNHLRFLEKQKKISLSAYTAIQRVSTWVAFLSVQANPLVLVILNFVFPWTAVFTHLLAKTKQRVANEIPAVVTAVQEWDFLFSLRSLYNYQTKTFAETSSQQQWVATDVYHPLLPQAVANSFSLSSLALITGSNMSGKSTFLRTIGVNQTLANMGAPVFATKLLTWPARLLTCIRVSDSLEHGISYFYSEVLRLKEVITAAHQEPCLFLIDEIFRGTNNKERFIGAKSLILELSRSPSIGVVTTHDLDLVELEKLNAKIKNYHFYDEARGKELYFSYSLRAGPSTSTNALQILKNVGLPILET